MQETDPVDVRAYLHRDGSVIMQISVEDLQNPQALYQVVSGYTFFRSACCSLVLATRLANGLGYDDCFAERSAVATFVCEHIFGIGLPANAESGLSNTTGRFGFRRRYVVRRPLLLPPSDFRCVGYRCFRDCRSLDLRLP